MKMEKDTGAKMKHSLLGSSDSERRFLLDGKLSRHAENELRQRNASLRGLLRTLFCLVIAGLVISFLAIKGDPTTSTRSQTVGGVVDDFPDAIPSCTTKPCFSPAKIRVAPHRPGFPSFWDYGHRGSLEVTYDRRAIKINGDRALLLGGSMHPSRATKMTWNFALDEAVRNGLNLITIYVMWSAHQPLPSIEIDWGFPGAYSLECDEDVSPDGSCGWNLASAIRSAAERGLFVHLRVGPYDCAEYNYGGIPEWLQLHKPTMELRRPNREWLQAMEGFISKLVEYITEHQLWAHQGGNIIMAQIENELGDDGAIESPSDLLFVDDHGHFIDSASSDPTLRKATIQDYADWCGSIAEKLAPNVTWTMCNGLHANNTILTCNAISDGDTWLENHGGNGRIQIDQPALFTEFEGGFQTWGSTVEKPLDYFWGRTARAMARDAMKWFARGGCHLNYYMFWGGYNRQRAAASGITNMYASDVPLCPSGQRHQPKFGHFEALHEVITSIAPTLLLAASALGESKPLRYQTDDGTWQQGSDQRMFQYSVEQEGYPTVLFLENNALTKVVVEVPIEIDETNVKLVQMNAESSILLVNGMTMFDSSSIDPKLMSVERRFVEKDSIPILLDWSSWQEPIGSDPNDPVTWTKPFPVEQTEVNVDSGVSSDYAWYETKFTVDQAANASLLYIDTQKSNAFVAFVDGKFAGAADNHVKGEGLITLSMRVGHIGRGDHKLSLLSESLGYHNLIGRWGGSTRAKVKGITGNVTLSLAGAVNMSLVDGRDWRSHPGLHGELVNKGGMKRGHFVDNFRSGSSFTPTWSSALFDTPRYDPKEQALFVRITSGRGHLYLNGKDLGRYWNITRGETDTYSEEHYFFPNDFLHTHGRLNELILFNAFGETRDAVELEVSWIAPSHTPNFKDEVDYSNACI